MNRRCLLSEKIDAWKIAFAWRIMWDAAKSLLAKRLPNWPLPLQSPLRILSSPASISWIASSQQIETPATSNIKNKESNILIFISRLGGELKQMLF
jgi:hypothetical protein